MLEGCNHVFCVNNRRVAGAGDRVPVGAAVAGAGARGGALGGHAPQLGGAERGRRLPAPHAHQRGAPRAQSQVLHFL